MITQTAKLVKANPNTAKYSLLIGLVVAWSSFLGMWPWEILMMPKMVQEQGKTQKMIIAKLYSTNDLSVPEVLAMLGVVVPDTTKDTLIR